MALTTALDIVNAACARIGIEPLQSLADEIVAGQSASLMYEDTVDFNLALNPFSFAQEMRQLSRLSGFTPLTGYTYGFDIPGERLGPPIWLTDDPTDPDRRFAAFVLTGGRVHASVDPLYAMVKFRPDPHLWLPAFKSCAITALAAKFALSQASDRALYNELQTEAYGTPSENFRGGQMRVAIFSDSYATPPRKPNFFNNPLERARYSGSFTTDPRVG